MTYQDDGVRKHPAESQVHSMYSVNVSCICFPSFFGDQKAENIGLSKSLTTLRKMGHSTKNRSDNIIKIEWMYA